MAVKVITTYGMACLGGVTVNYSNESAPPFPELEAAIQLRSAGQVSTANEHLVQLAQAYPLDARVQYHCAWSFDLLGREREAVPYYAKAISLGLSEDELRGAYLGLGSTYRTIGDYAASKAIFEDAIAVFPDDSTLQAFFAMTLYNLGEHARCMKILLTLLVNPAAYQDVAAYQRAIALYAEDLDRIW